MPRVIVCHCRAVNHRQIEAAALCGASSVREIVGACGAGGVCGGCRPAIEELLVGVEVSISAPAAHVAVA
ncbi:MAG: (2Fe-2S)-binding protein [Acidimicrobiales bacterium]|nr:(2Fe-2S)-binding protein [Acidimicrobiales bacterium]